MFHPIENRYEAAREFQISQEVAKRDAARMQLLQVEYRFGEGDSNSYPSSVSFRI
jgi:Zn-dependent peptidase ImmA (M78 family)